jgi:hypothetical protein
MVSSEGAEAPEIFFRGEVPIVFDLESETIPRRVARYFFRPRSEQAVIVALDVVEPPAPQPPRKLPKLLAA